MLAGKAGAYPLFHLAVQHVSRLLPMLKKIVRYKLSSLFFARASVTSKKGFGALMVDVNDVKIFLRY